MPRALALLLLVCLTAPGALAGPWPRGKGETFLSFAVEYSDSRDYGGLYAEHGLTENLTLGLDLGTTSSDAQKAIAFARWPIGETAGPLRMSVQFGIGYAERWRTPPFKLVIKGGGPLPPLPAPRPKMRPVVQTGLSVGRGLELLGHNGWVTLDTSAEIDEDLASHFAADATLGLRGRKGHMVIVQLQTGATDAGDTWAKLAPSYVLELSASQHLEMGLVAGLAGDNDIAARLGLWQKF